MDSDHTDTPNFQKNYHKGFDYCFASSGKMGFVGLVMDSHIEGNFVD